MALCFNNEFCTCVIRIFIFLDCTRLFCTGVGEVEGRTMSSAEELMTNDEMAVNFFSYNVVLLLLLPIQFKNFRSKLLKARQCGTTAAC